ncbi:glycoside hydrolase [Agrocybe pediades]|nr:glycoside hydrolase [Agrocybe pediades]
MLVMAYYPDWMGDSFPPSKIDFQRFDWIDFAFAVPKADASLAWDDPVSGPTLLEELVTSAHSHNSYVKLSIGGWTGSRYFSTIVSTEKGRSKFAENILATYNKFSLDGIDIDWEYPGQEGSPGNKHNSKDTANFLLFLQKLRSTLPPSARITAAVESTPFVDNKGKPLKDLTEFAEVLDWVLIMNYDVWGSSSNPGPNAPLYDACGNSTQPDASAVGAFNAWTRANFPASKLVLGLPSYGYISSSKAQHLRTRSNKGAEDSSGFKVKNDDGDSEGQVQFRELIKQGVLVPTSDDRGYPTYAASEGFETLWDGCSETPYIRSTSSGQIITYDSPLSLGMKAAFAKKVGMLGVNVFDVHGDTDTWDLVDSVRRALDLT